MNTAISLFLAFRKAEGLAERTIEDYEYHLTSFTKHIPEGTEDYRAAALSYLGAANSPNTFNLRFAYLKKFFDWGISEELLHCTHPLAGLKKRKPVNRIVHIENDTLTALLRLPNRKTFAGLRDHALMLFSMDCGARPGESLQLVKENFLFSALLVMIPSTVAKTRQARTIPITPQTVQAVMAVLSAHHPSWENVPVFCSENGSRLNVRSWTHRLGEYGDRLGMTITPYCLRHAAALGMLRAGMSVFALRDMLGHTTIAMT